MLRLLGMSLLGPLLRSLIELRTELLAVSCVGDFISCHARILLRFGNNSNTVYDNEKESRLILLYKMYELYKITGGSAIFRLLTLALV